MLRRIGCKKKLRKQIIDLFAWPISTYIEFFMGTGAIAFEMVDRVDFIFANDNDAEVFNLFMVAKDRREDLLDALALMPVHEALFKYWKQAQEPDPIWRAVRFLMLSNMSYLGKGSTLNIRSEHGRELLRKEIEKLQGAFDKIMLLCCDFRAVLSKIGWRHPEREQPQAFIYADPPYLGTENNYQNGFTEQDTADLFRVLVDSGMRFALSEFSHPVVIELATAHKLCVTVLGERQTLKNRQTEILITNYEPKPLQTDLFKKFT